MADAVRGRQTKAAVKTEAGEAIPSEVFCGAVATDSEAEVLLQRSVKEPSVTCDDDAVQDCCDEDLLQEVADYVATHGSKANPVKLREILGAFSCAEAERVKMIFRSWGW